jgi:hypothetical protein
MKAYHLSCEHDFKGANLCSNSGIYLSREKAEEVIVSGLDWGLVEDLVFSGDLLSEDRTLQTLLRYGLAELEEVEVE